MQIYAAGAFLPNYRGQNAGKGPGCLPSFWSLATRTHPSSPFIWQHLSEGRGCRGGSGKAAGALRFGEELQRFVLKIQVCVGGTDNMVGRNREF